MTLKFESMALVTVLIIMGLFIVIGVIGILKLRRKERFPKAYIQIINALYNSPITPGNYEFIEKLFDKIGKLPESRHSWNLEKLDVLEREFENKFGKLNKAI